jgi:hypothetical protein
MTVSGFGVTGDREPRPNTSESATVTGSGSGTRRYTGDPVATPPMSCRASLRVETSPPRSGARRSLRRLLPPPLSLPVAGSPERSWRSQSSLKMGRHADDRSATGEMTGFAPVGTEVRLTPLRPVSCTQRPESHALRGARDVAHRRDVPLHWTMCRQRSPLFDGHNAEWWQSPGNGVPEEAALTATQAGRRDARRWPEPQPRTTNASRHRRAASRSGGATSAERDGRPVERSTELQRQRQRQVQRQRTAGARSGLGYQTRSPVTVSVTDEADAENHDARCGNTGPGRPTLPIRLFTRSWGLRSHVPC